ncbi:MAG TPA: SRPBCC domain-containing protein [Puia sp.]|nr:SRPBCC domain-containing protein [Puia sp.]
MTGPLIVTNSILIHAPAPRVWDALVNPAQTKKYMFGCEALSDWKPGSSLLWQGEYEGKNMVFVKGKIVEIDPGKLLAYTTIDPNSGMEDIPENYVTVTYRLSEEKGQTLFSVEQGDFAGVADGERRYTETYNNGEGWNPILVQIKAVVEAG